MSINSVRDDIRFALFQGGGTSKNLVKSAEFSQFLENAADKLNLGKNYSGEEGNSLTQVSNYFDGLSSAQQQEWKNFQSQFRQSIQSDKFDLNELMRSAPETLKQYATDSGVDFQGQLAKAGEFAMELKSHIKSKFIGQLGGSSQVGVMGGGEVLQNLMDSLFSTHESDEAVSDSTQTSKDQLSQVLRSLFDKA